MYDYLSQPIHPILDGYVDSKKVIMKHGMN